jgi:putative NADH-flavin reductase
MKLTVFGASGGTGSQVVRQALDGGHEVLAVVRDPARVALPAHPNLQVLAADVMRPGTILPAVTGREAVISAIGSRDARRPTTVCADSARSIVEAMQTAGARRLVVVSGSGPFDEGDGPLLRYLLKPIGRRLLKYTFADFVAMETVVRASGLDWTILRPPRLTNGPLTGRYRTARDRGVRRCLIVSRADLAHLALAASEDRSAHQVTISVAR